MDVPVFSKLVDLIKMHQNPMGTPQGQLPVSIAEDMYHKLNRMGRRRCAAVWDASIAGGSWYQIVNLKPNIGFHFVVDHACVTCNCKAQMSFLFMSGIEQIDTLYRAITLDRDMVFQTDYRGMLIHSHPNGGASGAAQISIRVLPKDYIYQSVGNEITFGTDFIQTNATFSDIFKSGDSVTISGATTSGNNKTAVIRSLTSDKTKIFFPESTFTVGSDPLAIALTKTILASGSINVWEVASNA